MYLTRGLSVPPPGLRLPPQVLQTLPYLSYPIPLLGCLTNVISRCSLIDPLQQKPDHEEIELPSFDATPTKPQSPLKVTFKDNSLGDSDRHGDGDDGDSSDWSSSSESEGGEGDGGGGGASGGVMKPSHHTNLIAEWEWRTMNDGGDTRSVISGWGFNLLTV